MELNQQIENLNEIVSEKESYYRKLEIVKDEYYSTMGKLRTLKEVLDKEEKDVKKLESVSLSNIWFSILGNKIQHLNKEKREFSDAEFNYKNTQNTLDNLKKEMDRLTEKLVFINDCEDKLNNLLFVKEDQLMDNDSELREDIKDINRYISLIYSQEKELSEAIDIGYQVIEKINTILTSLNKAKNWGAVDLLGGGLLVSLAKHGNISDARSELEELNKLLRTFKIELIDVELVFNESFNLSDFFSFADIFLDGLISDIIVQDFINNLLDKMEKLKVDVDTIINKLKEEEIKCENKIQLKNIEKNQLLLNNLN